MRRLKVHKEKKEKKTKWTIKLGNKLGIETRVFFADKKRKYAFFAIVVILLFVFVIPVRKNIVTLSILVFLLILQLVLKKRNKK